jgi:hypothetical protein
MEFQHVNSELKYLSVIGNPFCLNPDHQGVIIEMLPDLVKLDSIKLNPKVRKNNLELRVKLESYLVLLVQFLRMYPNELSVSS